MNTQSTTRRAIAVLLAVFVLSGCGGGGGGGGAAATGTTDPRALGTRDAYFMSDCSGTCFGQRDGTPRDVTESGGIAYFNGVRGEFRRVQGASSGDLELEVTVPPLDVRQAWREGWSGHGVNILIVDEFGRPGRTITSPTDREGKHGYSVALAAAEIAPRATFGALENGIGELGLDYAAGGVRGRVTESSRFGVINHSFGLIDPSTLVPGTRIPSAASIAAERRTPEFLDLVGGGGLRSAGDAVITKAAGNDNGDAGHYADAYLMATDARTAPRTLIVGALNNYARTSNPQGQRYISTRADMASDSNHAGEHAVIQERFLVEYGGSPYARDAYLCDRDTPGTGCNNQQTLQQGALRIAGTSFAAPRVAGYAALVRDKFPNLSGAQTAGILLDTATTAGLACHRGSARKSSSCAANIYGQGRVDIGRALAPSGALR